MGRFWWFVTGRLSAVLSLASGCFVFGRVRRSRCWPAIFSRSGGCCRCTFGFWLRRPGRRFRLRVLLVDQFGEMGGAQRCLVEAAAGFAALGWELCALIPGVGSRLDEAGKQPAAGWQPAPLALALRRYGVAVGEFPCGPFASGARAVREGLR